MRKGRSGANRNDGAEIHLLYSILLMSGYKTKKRERERKKSGDDEDVWMTFKMS